MSLCYRKKKGTTDPTLHTSWAYLHPTLACCSYVSCKYRLIYITTASIVPILIANWDGVGHSCYIGNLKLRLHLDSFPKCHQYHSLVNFFQSNFLSSHLISRMHTYLIILRFEESVQTNSDSQTSLTLLIYARILKLLHFNQVGSSVQYIPLLKEFIQSLLLFSSSEFRAFSIVDVRFFLLAILLGDWSEDLSEAGQFQERSSLLDSNTNSRLNTRELGKTNPVREGLWRKAVHSSISRSRYNQEWKWGTRKQLQLRWL